MPQTTLIIAGEGESREVPLEAKGVILGRSSKCDVVLNSSLVSRQHARLFQDPFGRWIIEDLGSRAGVLVGGQRLRAHAVFPGEQIIIGPFRLSLSQPLDQEIPPDTQASTATYLIEAAADVRVTRAGPTADVSLSRDRLRELNRLVDGLDAVSALPELYAEVCRRLVVAPDTAALVVRLPAGAGPLPASPQVIAHHLGSPQEGGPAVGAENLYLSRRVLEVVRSSREPVMARSTHAEESDLSLTLVDERQPRAVLCVPIGESHEAIDALYLDMPMGEAAEDLFDFVQAVARHVRLVRRNLLLLEAKAQRRVLDYQLSLARQIQSKLVSAAVPDLPGVDVAVHYEPAMWVGGDYCDMWPLPDGRLALAVGDVAGKGLPAALVMVNLHAALRATMSYCTRLNEVSQHITDHLHEHMPEGMFVTMVLGIVDPARAQFEYVNAGHIPPLVVHEDGSVLALEGAHYMPFGILGDRFEAVTVGLTPGSSLVLVTDGITETMDAQGRMYGIPALRELLERSQGVSSQRLVAEIAQAASDFRQPLPQQDDVTVLALAIRGV